MIMDHLVSVAKIVEFVRDADAAGSWTTWFLWLRLWTRTIGAHQAG